ncbi:MAG: hypothetical protein HPY69_19405 [Armatimonadetes bacterium]|nr:hypothetical protein [Armatimonadota bacterium]
MRKRTRIILAVAGIAAGGLLAYLIRMPRESASPPPESPPLAPTETPAARQPRDRYVDERYGFVIPAPPGWHNEASGKLRRDFPDARGLLMQSNSEGRTFVEIRVLQNPSSGKPVPAKFLAGAKKAFGSAPGQRVTLAETRTVAGKPAVVLAVSTPGIEGTNIARYAWVFGDEAQVHLRMRNLMTDEAQAQAAFNRILDGLRWTVPVAPATQDASAPRP